MGELANGFQRLFCGSSPVHRCPTSTTIVGRIVIALPPLAEQRRIVAKVESLFAQTRALEAKLRQAQADIVTVNRAVLHRLSAATDHDAFAAAWTTVRDAFDLLYDDPRNVAELRQAILQLAVQGKLVPQDPADEPASELLKRIRAEKRRLVKEGKIREEKPLPLAAAVDRFLTSYQRGGLGGISSMSRTLQPNPPIQTNSLTYPTLLLITSRSLPGGC